MNGVIRTSDKQDGWQRGLMRILNRSRSRECVPRGESLLEKSTGFLLPASGY
jgi:hypothetical protein